MKSIIFLRSTTSGTGSIHRILTTLGGFDTQKSCFSDLIIKNHSIDQIAKTSIPRDGGFYRINTPTYLNKSIPYGSYRLLINFRDPRDRLCNRYHWVQSHPDNSLSEVELKKKRMMVRNQGIDNWVLSMANGESRYYDNFKWILAKKIKDCEILSYAELCLDFDSFIGRAADFLGVEINTDMRPKLELERISNLNQNKNWIGNQWEGSDIMPGRYLNELKPSTIKSLDTILKEELIMMAEADDKYSSLYLKGL